MADAIPSKREEVIMTKGADLKEVEALTGLSLEALSHLRLH